MAKRELRKERAKKESLSMRDTSYNPKYKPKTGSSSGGSSSKPDLMSQAKDLQKNLVRSVKSGDIKGSVTKGNRVVNAPAEEEETYSRIPTDAPIYSEEETKARSVLYDVDDFDENTRRKELLKGADDQIKGVEDIYKQKEQVERDLGVKDLNRSNTISALTGMGGAPEATTRAGNSDRRTAAKLQNVQDQKSYALSSIYKTIDTNLAREKEAHLTTQRANAENILKEVAQNAAAALSSFAAEGISWETLQKSDPDTIKNLVRQTGKDPFTLQQLYNDALPPDKKPQTLFEGFKGNNYVTIKRNPDGTITNETFDAEELGLPDTFTDPTSITLGGNVYWYDKDAPLGADGKPKLILVGAKASSKGDSDDEDEGSDVPAFDDWKQTDEAQKILNDELKERTKTNGSASFTDSTADQFLRSVYNESIRSQKTSKADKTKNYSAANIPSDVKTDLVADISQNGATIQQLYSAYPEVSTSYISSLYNSLKKKKDDEEETEEEELTDEEFIESLKQSVK